LDVGLGLVDDLLRALFTSLIVLTAMASINPDGGSKAASRFGARLDPRQADVEADAAAPGLVQADSGLLRQGVLSVLFDLVRDLEPTADRFLGLGGREVEQGPVRRRRPAGCPARPARSSQGDQRVVILRLVLRTISDRLWR
jgi:hypothetical protein